jgi:2-polyprenyl-3-methyl-5-hydroxy-6-metoxy-1,4-benzoquinol methylase
MRPCPYCEAVDARIFGERGGATYLRCARCKSIHKDLTVAEYLALHEQAFGDMEFIDDAIDSTSDQPNRKTWSWIASMMPSGPVLEVGPGSGHLLAAARETNRDVFGVEASAVHREFIQKRWDIRNIFATMEELPSTVAFAGVVAVNTIEHVLDVAALFRAIRPRLAPNGVVFVSTCNARYMLLPIIGISWTMFKVPDHVSIPAAEGFRLLAERTGFRCNRVWTGELPLETPIAVAVSLRDWMRERRRPASGEANGVESGRCEVGGRSSRGVPFQRRLARRLMRMGEHTDPIRHVNALVGRAAAIRGLFSLRA